MDDAIKELTDEQTYTWLEMHKKSAISFLILKALDGCSMWSGELIDWLSDKTGWDLSEKSLYRTLRRLHKQGSVNYVYEDAERTGADRKVYTLTEEGAKLLENMKAELDYLRTN